MSSINHASRELTCKLVYYGPGLSGKTTNVAHIHARARPESRGKFISLKTESERTLFFDFLPLQLGKVRGFDIRVHLYTVPGQVFYRASRQLIVRGCDGLVFVADSQPERLEANLESLACMWESLAVNGIDGERLPLVLQCNKQDIPGVLSPAELGEALGLERSPQIPAAAVEGVGVFETFKALGRLVLRRLEGPAKLSG